LTRLDPLVLVFTLGIALFGIHAIDLGVSETTPRPLAAIQWNYFLFGAVVMVAIGCVPYARWVALGPFAWTALVGLLIGVAVMGTTVNGSRRWLSIGGFAFQPSEPMKTALVLLLAKCLDRGDPVRRWTQWVPLFILAFVPFALVVRQPDLGTALMYVPIAAAVLFVAGLPLRVVGGLLVSGAALAFAAFRWLLHP
jgi:rod shape determining protein RodA